MSTTVHAVNARATSRREALFEAVIESVGTHGFERASLRDIAARAGMSHAGLLSHFSSKEELLLAALENAEQQDHREVSAIIAQGASDREVIETLVRRATDDRDKARQWLALVVASSDPTHPAHEYFRERHARFRRQVELVAANPDNVTVGLFDPETRATLYRAVLDGLRLEWLVSPETDVVAAAGRFTDLILRTRVRD
ncbi:TetR/AcrR family transcriptional regulator [Leifsonia sp. 2MCAF36]|uniref:TetR/AcrR family transcriptional regulator n=1 Tax=Leifsonia sp. 2MCAF36 TaxID=3232988 RepID=UPI003F946C22